MEMDDKTKEALRKKAEIITESQTKKGIDVEALSIEDVKAIIHDLRVHQIELEIQNEELRHIQSVIQQTRDSYSELYNNAPIGYLVLDNVGIISQANQTFIDMIGYKEDGIAGRAFVDFIHPEDKQIFLSRFRAFVRDPGGKIMDLRLTNGRRSWFYCRFEGRHRVLPNPAGQPEKRKDLFVVLSNIDEQKNWQTKLEHLNVLLKSMGYIKNRLIAREKDRHSLMNQVCSLLTENLGYLNFIIILCEEPCEKGDPFEHVFYAGLSENISQVIDQGWSMVECPCIKTAIKTKETIFVNKPSYICTGCPLSSLYGVSNVLIAPMLSNQKLYGILYSTLPSEISIDHEEKEIISDIASSLATALHIREMEEAERKAKDTLKIELKEKEILLKEVHHRVKNNLMLIESLIYLQCRYTQGEEFIKTATNFSTRIHALAEVHDKLYRSESLSRIDFKEYAESIIQDLSSVYSTGSVEFITTIDSAELSIEAAIPLGLILNELISNALKYAFPDNCAGKVYINFSKDTNMYVLKVKDTGVGMPPNFDLENSDTLGITLIKILSEQLGGVMKIGNSGEQLLSTQEKSKGSGAEFCITFPV